MPDLSYEIIGGVFYCDDLEAFRNGVITICDGSQGQCDNPHHALLVRPYGQRGGRIFGYIRNIGIVDLSPAEAERNALKASLETGLPYIREVRCGMQIKTKGEAIQKALGG